MKILILGGGYQQLPAIRKAHEMGLTVLLADYLADAPGRTEAEQSFLVSTRDREKVLELARREEVDGILAFASDPAAETAAYVAEQLGLPGNTQLAAATLGNKEKFRIFLAENGIPSPRYFPVDFPEKDFAYPILVKPLDSSGSKGVTLLRNYDAGRLLRAYQNAVSYSLSGKALAEECISYGYRHLIGGDVIVRHGNIALLGLMDCLREEPQNLVPCGKIYPCGAGKKVTSRIAEIMQLVICRLSIKDAEMNVEFIAGKDGEVYPIEIALRCGGNGIPQLLSDATGVDWIREEVRRTLREKNAINFQEGHLRSDIQMEEKECMPSGNIASMDTDCIYATYNLHADQEGLYAGYELCPELSGYLYREEIFRRKGESVGPYENAAGIIGILYFRFTRREEAEKYLYDMPRYLRVRVVSVRPVKPDAGIRADIMRLGEFMTPPFSVRKRCWRESLPSGKSHTEESNWNTEAYAEKLICLSEFVTAENEKGDIIGLIAAYLNRSDFGFISMLVVMPEYRRCGVAEALCEEIHRMAREKNIPCICGEIWKENMACRRLAGMLGYEEYTNVREGFVGVRKNILSEPC